MKTKPKKLDLLAGFLVALAPMLPLQIMVLYGHTPFEIGAIAAKLTPLNWAIFALAPVTGFLVWRASFWSLFTLPVLAAVVAYNNWFVGRLGLDYAPWMTDLGTLAFVAMCGVVLSRDVLPVMINPQRRWWMTPARKEAAVQVRVQIHNKQFRDGIHDEFFTHTFDISEGGAFIPFGQERFTVRDLKAVKAGAKQKILDLPVAKKLNSTQLKPGTQCFVSINVKETDVIQCRAEIVRVAESHGRYPAGMGIRFLGLTWEERRTLAGYLKAIPAQTPAAPVSAAAA